MPSQLPLTVGGTANSLNLTERVSWFLEDQRDIEIQDGARADFLHGNWRAVAKEIATMLDGHRGARGIHAPYEGYHVGVPDSGIARAVTDMLLKSLEFAAAVGGSHVVLHSPFLFFGAPLVVHGADDRLRLFERIHRNLQPIVEAAAAQSCLLVFENICDLNPEPLDSLVRSFDSPWVGRSLDTGHANLMRPRGGPPSDVWVQVAGELLKHVHLADNDGEADRHWACGEGTINWRSTFEAIAALESRPRLILEVRPDKQMASLRWLAERGLAK